MGRYIAIMLFVCMLLPATARAQCTMPSGPPAEAGVILFNNDHKVMQYCNGEKWIGLWGGRGGEGWVTPPNCTGEGKALQWSGTAWLCATIEGGGGSPSFDLVNGMHSSEQCTNLGGTVITSGSDKFCRFNGTACPAGWAAYQNWTTTIAKTCSNLTSCTAAAHAWSNQAPKTCTYKICQSWVPNEGPCSSSYNAQCTATVTQIGCY